MHFIDADANTLLQKKLISQFVFSEQQDPKDLEFIKNKQVRNAILERNRKNLFTCPICTKEHYLPDLKINEPVVMKCGFCNFEIYINKRESGAISKSDNQWLKFQFKMGAIEDQIADIEEQIEDIDDAIDCIENPDEYDSDMYPNIEKYRKLDKETLEAKKEPLLKKKKKLDDKLDPFIDKYYDMKDRYSNRRDRWTTKYEEHSWDEFKEEIRNR